MNNRAMERKIQAGIAVDVADCPTTCTGAYILREFIDSKDYCDAKKEAWIWSIARVLKPLPSVLSDGRTEVLQPGTYLASTDSRFYNPDSAQTTLECVFLR